MGAVTEPPQQRTLQLTHDATHQAAQHSPDNGAIDPVIAAREPHILRWTRTDTWVFSIIAIVLLWLPGTLQYYKEVALYHQAQARQTAPQFPVQGQPQQPMPPQQGYIQQYGQQHPNQPPQYPQGQ